MESETVPAAENTNTRKQYTRDFLLDIKKNVSATSSDTFDKHTRTLLNGLHRGNRNKNKSGFAKARDNDRSRDSNGIILGPQKRVWNTGCHVSQSPVSDTTENAHSYRNNARNDRSSRGTDYKRDYRNGNHVPPRDRGNRRNETVSNRRPYAKDDRYNKTGRSHNDEPEWFSEGPANVSETIELGGILDDIPEISGSSTEKENKTISCDTPETNLGMDASEKEETQPREEKTDPIITEPTNDSDTQLSKHSENHGSRFKHLFSRPDSNATDTDAISRQLLQLLRGASKAAPTSSTAPRADVLQVEKKLRAILLGHEDVANNTTTKISEYTVNKPHVLTVEEIEAQLTPKGKLSPQPYPDTERSKFGNGLTELPSLKTNSSTNEANSTTLLHTLMKQQQVACSQSVHMRNALNTLGILGNPATRLPTSNNAVSANACISQIQKSEPSQAVENTNHTSSYQHVLGNLPRNALSPLHATSQPYSSNVLSQGLLNFQTTHSTHGSSGPVHNSGLSTQRRPIVKANQASSAIQKYLQTCLMDTEDNGQRRLQNSNQHMCMNDISQFQFGHSEKYTPFPAPGGSFDTLYNNNPLLVPGISSAVNNNNSASLHAQLPAPVSRMGPMTFLSHMASSVEGRYLRDADVQAHRISNNCGAASGGELGGRVRTLEEIEQCELLGGTSYL